MKLFYVDRLLIRSAVPIALLLLLGPGCMGDPKQPGTPDGGPVPPPPPPADGGMAPPPPPPPRPGLPTFLSADELQYHVIDGEEEEEEEEEEENPVPGTMPELQENDVYRILADGTLINLNYFRGLQLIDMSNAAQPAIVGRLHFDAEPHELLVTGNHAIVLAGQRQRGKRVDVGLGIAEDRGGVIFLVDLSDRTAPRVVDSLVHEGSSWQGMLADRNGQPMLYMTRHVTRTFQNADGSVSHEFATMLDSYRIADGSLVAVAQLELPAALDYVRLLPDAALVSRHTYDGITHTGSVSIIDISAPDGSMALRGTVSLAGEVESPRHVDLRGGTLRVFSGPTPIEQASHLQIWNVSDLDAPILVDEETFAVGEHLYGAVLLDDRAFASTYQPFALVNPLHAFAIDGAGNATQISELASGWNDFFQPALDDTRLLGVAVDDVTADSDRVTVSLYDIADLANPSPLVARLEVLGLGVGDELATASWNYRGLTIHEDSAAVQAPTGELETGMILIPFRSNWYENDVYHQQDGAQIFTFSSSTITRRGVILQGAFTYRNFPTAAGGTMGSLSFEELSLFDRSDLDHPADLGRVELMPEYTDILSYGDHRVRLKAPIGGFLWYLPRRPLEAQVISSAAPADDAAPVASFPLPDGSKIFKVGESILAAVRYGYEYEGGATVITTYDLANPRQPRQLGQLVTGAIPNLPPWYRAGEYQRVIHAVGNVLVFVNQHPHDVIDDSVMGTVCRTSLTQTVTCAGQVGCTYAAGEQTCHDFGEGTQFCAGGFARCTDHGNGDSTCEPRAAEELEGAVTSTVCEPATPERRWTQLELFVVDFGDPAAPRQNDSILLPPEHEAVSVLVHGSDFYVTTKVPVDVPGDPRPYAAHYVTRVELAQPGQPVVHPAVNVPGELVAVLGERWLTRDKVWSPQFVETALVQIRVAAGHAVLERYHRFAGRAVGNAVADDTGLVAVKHGQVWGRPWGHALGAFDDKLLLMRMGATTSQPHLGLPDFIIMSEKAVEHGPEPFLLAEQRLLLRIFDGLEIIDVSDPAAPVPRAFFQTNGALAELVLEGGELLTAAGRYGVLRIDLDTDNLLDAAP
jgi:hypothetical protein